MQFQDITGLKFNKLRVVRYAGKNKTGQSRWLCKCDCGNEHQATASHLKKGDIKSCGCLVSSEARRKWSLKHGYSRTPEYESYHSAKKRCNPKHSHIKNYADWVGRGIEFRFSSFEEFIAEVGPRPEPKFSYSLEREDNDGHYEKGNVRWATKKEQARNRRCDRCATLRAEVERLTTLLDASKV